jgi:hypothetical protein
LRSRHHDELGGIARQPDAAQRLPNGIVEMGPQDIDGDGLAGNVADGFDRAVLEHIEYALDPFVQAARRISRDEVVAAGNGVDHRSGGRGADIKAARCEREKRFRSAGRISEILHRDTGPLVVAELVGQFVRIDTATAGEIAQGHDRGRRLREDCARHGRSKKASG